MKRLSFLVAAALLILTTSSSEALTTLPTTLWQVECTILRDTGVSKTFTFKSRRIPIPFGDTGIRFVTVEGREHVFINTQCRVFALGLEG